MCNLQENLEPPICSYPGTTLTIMMKGFLKAPDGSFLGAVADVAQNVPTVSDLSLKADSKWHEANDPLPEPLTLVTLPQPVQFSDQDGKELITLTRILGGFYGEMHREGQMSARKTHRFENPTFVKLIDPPFHNQRGEPISNRCIYAQNNGGRVQSAECCCFHPKESR